MKHQSQNILNKPLKHRYPGTQPFSIEQQEIFYGRKDDIENLFDLLRLENLVVLHSQSGLGKSSLINAGVLPKIESQINLIPFSVRFRGYKEKQEDNLIQIFLQELEITSQNKISSYLDKIIPDDNSIWYHMKNKQVEEGDPQKGFLFVFDQFEELFTYPKKKVLQFAAAIKELLSDHIPQRFSQALREKNKSKDIQLSNEEQKAFYEKLNVKFLFVIRSDRMSLMNDLKDYFPDILRNCQELMPLTIEQAEDALLQPAYKTGNEFICTSFDYDDDCLDEILSFLTQNHAKKLNNSLLVDSFGLQILCQNIEKKVIEKNIHKVTKNDIGNIASIYNNHYNNLIANIGSYEEQVLVRILIEEGLIFEKGKIRLSLYESAILENYNITKGLLKKLLDSHLLRAEEHPRGRMYELSHDSFIDPILNAKRERIEEERIAQLKEKQEQEAKKELKKLRKDQEKFRREIEFKAEKSILEAKLESEKIKVQEKKEKLRELRTKRNWLIFLMSISVVSIIISTINYQRARKKNSILENINKELIDKNIYFENLTYRLSQSVSKTDRAKPNKETISGLTKSQRDTLFELNKGLNYSNLGLINSRKIKEIVIKDSIPKKKADSLYKYSKNNFLKADSIFNQYKDNPLIINKHYTKRLAKGYGSLSFNLLFIKKYIESEKAAIKGLRIDSSTTWIKTNLAHALLFQGKYVEAEKIYREIKDIKFVQYDYKTLGGACLDDFKKLEEKKLIPIEYQESVEKIKSILKN